MNFTRNLKGNFNALVRRSYWFNNIAFPDCRKFWMHSVFHLDVVNLGSTSGKHAFNYSNCDLRAANWAMSPQSFLTDFEILQNYFSYLKRGAYILLPICPFSCMVGYDAYIPDRYYTVLRHSSIPNFSIKRKNEIMNMKNSPLNYYPLVELRHDLQKIIGIKPVKSSIKNERGLKKDANNRMKSWMEEFSISDFNNKLSLKNQDSYNESAEILVNMIQFCKDRGFHPVIVLPPVTKYLSDKFTPEMQNLLISSFVQKVISNMNDTFFLNYFTDEMGKEMSFFQNSFYLNKRGAKIFTEKVLKDLSIL